MRRGVGEAVRVWVVREGEWMELLSEKRLAAQTGAAFRLAREQVLRITDPEGEQVADVTAFAAEDPRERYSSGRTGLDYAETVLVTTGHVLYSNRSRVMATIVGDTAGQHDLLLAPCSAERFRIWTGSRRLSPELPGQPRESAG